MIKWRNPPLFFFGGWAKKTEFLKYFELSANINISQIVSIVKSEILNSDCEKCANNLNTDGATLLFKCTSPSSRNRSKNIARNASHFAANLSLLAVTTLTSFNISRTTFISSLNTEVPFFGPKLGPIHGRKSQEPWYSYFRKMSKENKRILKFQIIVCLSYSLE